MAQLADLFSVPEMSLLCNVTEYFVQNNLDYHPDILFRDVKVFPFSVILIIYFLQYFSAVFNFQSAVQSIHPLMHQVVQSKPEEYLEKDPHLESFFDKLIKAGKKLFLVTNSPFNFV